MATRTIARATKAITPQPVQAHLIPKRSALPPGSLTGIVVSAGKMQRTVKVRTSKQKFNAYLKKYWQDHSTHMVADPSSSLREGDVVRIARHVKTKKVKHVVTDLMVPFGATSNESPALPGLEGVRQMAAEKRAAKRQRKTAKTREALVKSVGEEKARDLLERRSKRLQKTGRINSVDKVKAGFPTDDEIRDMEAFLKSRESELDGEGTRIDQFGLPSLEAKVQKMYKLREQRDQAVAKEVQRLAAIEAKAKAAAAKETRRLAAVDAKAKAAAREEGGKREERERKAASDREPERQSREGSLQS